MKLPRLSPRQQAALAVALALILWFPTGISYEQQPVVTGHSTFYNGDAFDTCLASIAGILRSRVMWFNDMVLAERYAGKGTYVYISERGGQDPTTADVLYSDGVFFDFVDPNGAAWHVQELYIRLSTNVNGQAPGGSNLNDNRVKVEVYPDRQYVWVVELAERPIHDQFAGDPNGPYYHDIYNFLVLVDTCKMNRDHSQPGREQAGAEQGHNWNVTHEGADLSTERGHPSTVDAHDHEYHLANVYVGRVPNVALGGIDTGGAQWQSEWATSESAPQGANNKVNQTGAN